MENTPVKIEALLQIEALSDSETEKFSIVNAKEIETILGDMAEKMSRAALYYNNAKHFILTTVMGVDDAGFWLEQGPPGSAENKHIIESDDLFFVSSHLSAKVEFATGQAHGTEYDGYPAFYFHIPEEIYRLQRRECFRLNLPPSESLRCVIPAQPGKQPSRQIAIVDISLGGMKLSCAISELELKEGQTYENCKIKLPDAGTIDITIKVKNVTLLTPKSGQVIQRAGCEFINIDGSSSILLQRYVTNLQRSAKARTE